ncbi:MAG: GNAT family N-acetyltransferase, partial [Pseudomonadota bacterium]
MQISLFGSFAELPADAQNLAVNYRAKNPFVCDIWLQRYEEFILAEHDKAVYLVAHQDDVTQAMLPLVLTRHEKLRFKKLHSMANFYTTVFEPLLNETLDQSAAADALAFYLLNEFNSVPLCEIEPLREAAFLELLVANYTRLSGREVRRYEKHVNRFEVVADDTYESYLARRPGQLRSTLKRKRKQLERLTDGRVDIYESYEDVAREYPNFRTVYEHSWKGEERFPDFIGAVVADLARVGKSKLGILYIDGQPAAAQIWMRLAQTWGVFKLAYQPQYAQYSVGTLLTAAMIET